MKLKPIYPPAKRHKGSSSVLVIMVMLMLITFGVLAMMSSYANLKIARKNAQWISDYYLLEMEATETLTHLIDGLKSENLTKGNILDTFEKRAKDLAVVYDLENWYFSEDLKKAFVAYTVHNPSLDRRFFTALKVDLEGAVEVIAWKELPRVFEYDDGINFIDIGG